MKKTTKVLLALSVVVIIGCIRLWEISNQPHPKLFGSYQSDISPPDDFYMLSFNQKNEYEVYRNSFLADNGSYSKVADTDTYIIDSKTENQLIFLLEDDEFYYYAPDGQVFLLKVIDKVPTRLNQSENLFD